MLSLARLRVLAGNHWDDVIQQYKELELANYKVNDTVQSILDEVQDKINKVMEESIVFLPPHVIDLSAEGSIGKQVLMQTKEKIPPNKLHTYIPYSVRTTC